MLMFGAVVMLLLSIAFALWGVLIIVAAPAKSMVPPAEALVAFLVSALCGCGFLIALGFWKVSKVLTSESEVAASPDRTPGSIECSSCGKRIKPRAADTTCYLCGGSLGVSPRPS